MKHPYEQAAPYRRWRAGVAEIPAAEVDPVYLDASYYVVPEAAAEKAYTLLYEALRRSSYAALAQWTCHNREHLVLLRPGRCGLLLHTLFYADEVRARDEFRTEVEWVAPREVELAGLLVEALAARFEPGKYKDTYRENLQLGITPNPAPDPPTSCGATSTFGNSDIYSFSSAP